MRITKAIKQANHERIVAAASKLFRERGFEGVGVAELMKRAGLTHGGFYNHFRSKEELVAQASAGSFAEMAQRYGGQGALATIERYVSRQHRDAPGRGCPAAALGGDAARQPQETKAVFAAGIEALVRDLQKDLGQTDADRARAMGILAQAVGALVLSRACPDDAPLADEILQASRAACREAIG